MTNKEHGFPNWKNYVPDPVLDHETDAAVLFAEVTDYDFDDIVLFTEVMIPVLVFRPETLRILPDYFYKLTYHLVFSGRVPR